ncbi:hypothetical protein IC229_30525 [Spirosoma sp. BT702]|uniref:DUF6734 domain-containing protein n=1 Tax=Spirosoma profusum TaxID=2771354 RepID=A0A927AV78_9BACT|nr:DUF6734 family protein [Spirosoma profusum]MBD2705004.1 hypothetical protein [Spirosoma profusum]
MKSIQSTWFNEFSEHIDYHCGWLSPGFNLFSWSLSSLQLSKLFNKTELVTDDIGAELASRLQLPYSSIKTNLEAVKHESYLWVSNKLYTYSIQNEPFIHLDTDAYLFNQVDRRLLTASLTAQNFEYDHDNYIQAYQDILTHFKYVPDWICKDAYGRLTAINAGFIGGNDASFFQEFTTVVADFLERNQAELGKCQYDYLNVFVEQLLFKKYADFKNIPIEYISPIEFGPPCDYKMAEFTQLPVHCNYVHITNYKRNPTVCEQMAQRLWLESPKLYERVLTVCRQLEASHHAISQPAALQPVPSPFYRTEHLLNSLQAFSLFNKSAEELEIFIDALPEGQLKVVVTDVFQYECRRQDFSRTLPEPAIFKSHWQHYSQQTNTFLGLPLEVFSRKSIRQSAYCFRIESEWNWAEANEFAGQTADRNLIDNLQTEPAYYETLLYVYPHAGIIREHLLDAINILILDALETTRSIDSVVDGICDQVTDHQSQVDHQQLRDTIINRIRHFLYHGVLEVV